MSRSFNVVVIGAGPAGYVAAIRCAQLGLRTACIDDWRDDAGKPVLGGTCLNAGCIPSKALLQSSEYYDLAAKHFGEHGINIDTMDIDVETMMKRKDRVVRQLTGGIASLFDANNVAWLQGHGQLLGDRQVAFTPHGKTERHEVIEAEHTILASGSKPSTLEAAPIDGKHIVDSSGALAFARIPKTLAIIGAGVIGLELGSVWQRLGSKVTLLEAQDEFLSIADQHIAHEAFKQFGKQGLDIRLGARVISTKQANGRVAVRFQHGGEEQGLEVERLVVAVGRTPNTNGLAAPESGLLLDERGFVHVDERCATNLPGVYAIGDVVRGPMLAHKGSEEGMTVAESIASGRDLAINYESVPSVIYTQPEIAWVGRTEQSLHAAGTPTRVGTFPFAASGRARALEERPSGMTKVIAHGKTDRILGVHIIGPVASELIAEAVLAMEFSASSEDLARTIHAHPTLSETLHEAALAVDGRAIHMPTRPKKR